MRGIGSIFRKISLIRGWALCSVFGLDLLVSPIVLAENVYIARDESVSADQMLLVERLKTGISSYLPGAHVLYWNADATRVVSESENVIVTLGEKGLRAVLGVEGQGAVIAAFISQATYHRVVSEFPKQTRKLTAVFSNPSPRRQLALAKSIYGSEVVVGILQTSTGRDSNNQLELAARDIGITIEQVVISGDENNKQGFDRFENINAFLLQKDEDLFKIAPLDKILLMAYDINGYGVIGYSNGVVRNGGLATTYSSLEDNTKSISSRIASFFQTEVLAAPNFAEYYSVGLNKYVARSLSLKKRDIETLKQDISTVLEGDL